MSFLTELAPNKPTASLEGYFITMLAPSKFGKTTFAIDLAKTYYKGDLSKTLLLGTEIGYKTMDGVYAIPITGFDYAEEDDGVQRGFIETVDELIENKDDIPFRFIIIDTITALERYANSYVINKANREDQPATRYTDISDIAWGKGYNMVAEAIYTQVDRLKKNGFGVFLIGHSKTKKIKNRDGFEYDYTTLNVLGKTSDIVEREADLIIFGDIQVVKDGKTDVATERKLRFRSDGNILCGTRFRHFPDEIENDVDVFLEEFEKAVLNSYGNDKKAVAKAKKEEVEAIEEKHTADVEAVKEDAPKGKTAEELIEEINDVVSGFERAEKLKLAKVLKEKHGTANFKELTDTTDLKEVLELAKELA